MSRVYLETSFVSACVTDRSDPASAYRRQASLDWWDAQSAKHELFASAEVVAELSAPGFRHKAEALERIAGLPLLDLNEDVFGLANKLSHLRSVCVRMALFPPRIVTPDLLWED